MSESKIAPTLRGADVIFPASAPVSTDEQFEPLRHRTAVLLLSILLLYTGLTDIYKASRKLFWFDEICTVSLAGRQTLPAILDALHTSPDGNPPLFHYLEALTSRAVSNPQIGYRLNSIAGVLCLSICAFLFVRGRIGDTAGLIAAVFPLLTAVGTVYAIEARPYGMVMGCLGLALLAWRKADRLYAVSAFAVFLALAVSLHYYAILSLAPFAAGEVVRWKRTGRFRPAPWLAMLFGALPLVVCWPLLAIVKSYYGTHFWGTARFVRIPAYYDANVDLGDGVGAAAAVVLGIGLLIGLAAVLRKRPGLPGEVPVEDYAVILAFLLLPFVGYAATKIMHGGFTPRYVLASVLGISIAVAYLGNWAGTRTTVLLLSFMVAALGFREARYWMLDARLPAPVSIVQEDVLQTAAADSLPLVISNSFDYMPLAYYDHGRNRFMALVDPESAVKFIGTDSLDVSMLAVRRLLPLNVQEYREFAALHSRFLLYSRSADPWNWWPARLKSDGAVLRPLLIHENQTLFLVDLNTSQSVR